MNPLRLFETENVESIKLGIQVVKTLNKENEFKIHFKRGFDDYCDIFENVFLIVVENNTAPYVIDSLLRNNMDLTKITANNTSVLIKYYPQFIDRIDLTELENHHIRWLLKYRPEFIDRLDISKMNGDDISWLLQSQPQLIDRLELEKMNGEDFCLLIKYQPQLVSYFNI